MTLGALLTTASITFADFNPIALNPASYNHDVVVEAAAPPPVNIAVNVTMDGGTNKNGNTWYEKGYNPAAPTSGLPPAGSLVTNAGLNHVFQMPPDYHVNNVIMVGHNNGGRTLLLSSGTLTLTTPAAFSGLSFLTCSGNGPVLVGYSIHYADASTESGSFSSLDWFNTGAGLPNVLNTAGVVSISAGGVNNIGGAARGAAFAADVTVGNPAVNITSVDLFYNGSGTGANLNNTNSNGRAVIFAIAGSTDSVNFNPVAVTGFTYDAVVEFDGPPTTGSGVAAGSTLTNNVSASMDGGLSKANNCWYEKGYYALFPNSGLPAPGATVRSATLPASYTMPPSYTTNCATLLSSNVTSANIIFSSPAAYGALSFLCATANGDTFIPCVVNFQNGTSETNTIFVPDWFNRVLPMSYLSFGRVNPNNRTVNNTPDQFVNPFATPSPGFDFRGLGLPVPRLFDAVINVTNTSAITSIALSFTNGISTRVAAIFAVSGVPVGNVPPVFGSRGTPTPGQPTNAALNAVNLVKRWEGTNNVVLSVTNIAGTGPISYQWKKAPRGGGLHDIFYSIDYNTFANVTDGGRISGANLSALVISNALLADSADYLVVASNPYGAVTSLVATVMILTTNQSILVGVPAGDVITPIASDVTPPTESIDHVIDRVAQKWLSDGLQSPTCCPGPLPFTGPIGFVVTPVSGSSIVSSMRFFTANDGTGRDPFDYGLEGSNDGTTWSPITGGLLKGTLSLPLGRNGTGAAALDALNQFVTEVDFANASAYKSYRVSITNNINIRGDGLMQIAEIELLGTFVPAPPVWVRQPEPAITVYVGASPTFAVQATGLGSLAPNYQWYKNDTTLIAGATNKTYTFPNAQLADSGTTFRSTASNAFGGITSSSSTLTVIAAPTQSYPATILADNAIGYWRLNEGPDNGAGNNGVVAHDYRGGHNGSYNNSIIGIPGYNPARDPDTAADFGNFAPMNSYVADIKDVSFARASNTIGAAFSVEAWVNGGDQTVNAGIVTKGYNGGLNPGTGTGTEQFVLDVAGGPRKFRFLVRDAGGQGYAAQSSVVPYDPVTTLSTWRHLVGVCDQANGKLYLYVNGLLAASADIATNVGILTQPLPMTIGARKSSGASEYDNQWQGLIDDVAIYNSALSASQALNHFFAAQRPPIITLQPTNVATAENVSVTFYSSAYGPGTLSYQWYLSDGTMPTSALGGQTSSNLTFTTTAAQNNNFYQLVVTNQYGAATGAVAQLTVVSGPPSFFVDLPSSDTFYTGHLIQLRVVASGTAPFTYQWQKNSANISDNYRTSGSQSNVLTIGCANPSSDGGNYRVIVSNGQGSTPSTVEAVTVITATPPPAFNAAGTGYTLQGTPTPPVMGNNRLELTSSLGGTARSAFLTAKQSIGSFNASFVYQTVSGAGGADGVTFCIQNDTRGAAAVGAGGGSLGYGGITPSVALALNIYDPGTRGIRFVQNGVTGGPYSPITPVLVGGNANPIQINLTYAGGVVAATFKDTVTAATFTTNITVDIPAIVGSGTAYVGFTGGDGGTVSTQVISNFTMTPPPVTLKVRKVGDSLLLSWPAGAGACLQSTPTLTSPVWTDSTDPFQVVGNEAQVTITPLIGTKFYRLTVYP